MDNAASATFGSQASISPGSKFGHGPMVKDAFYPIIERWLEAWWELDGAGARIVPEILPDEGVVTTHEGRPIVASFIYNVTGVNISLHAYLVTDPQLKSTLRHAAVSEHIEVAVHHAESIGCTYQLWQTEDPRFTDRLIKKHGFESATGRLSTAYHISGSGPKLAALEE
jgi:hypothetical protein